MMPAPLRLTLWLLAALLVPIIPFVILGDGFEQHLLNWLESGLPAAQIALGLCGLLTVDLLLPVPSTAVTTYAGGVLPWGLAFLCAFGGLSAGHLIGLGMSRVIGRPFAERWAKADDLKQLDQLSLKYGPVILIATRAMPLLSEASVLLLGLTRLPFWLAAIAIVMSNAVIAAVYVSVGAWFQGTPALIWAIIGSAVLPLIPLWWFRGRLSQTASEGDVRSIEDVLTTEEESLS
ncbi:MAG: VTT domain-containing protein [Planctomycetaceae bacterium]|nr:VTT domain-containing protein [Planctomycetaceae bacterium]